jgi:hypothetical protein
MSGLPEGEIAIIEGRQKRIASADVGGFRRGICD